MKLVDTISDGGSEDPAAKVRSRDLREKITRGLDGTSKLVIVLHEFGATPWKEVGDFLLCRNHVSRNYTHTLAMAKIKANALRELYEKTG